MSVVHGCDAPDVERVGPDGVVPYVRFRRRHDDVVVESHHLVLLRVAVIAVNIFQGEDAVGAVGNTLDDKMAARVGAGHTEERTGAEDAVVPLRIAVFIEVFTTVGRIESHHDAFHGFERLSLDDISRYLHRVDLFAGREGIGVVAQRITLVVVADGIREVDGVGRIGFQRVKQLHDNLLAGGLDFGNFQLGRRHHHVLRGIVYLDEFIEMDGYLSVGHVGPLVVGC